ncbi:MAG: DMT family transporter [Novosphingobium sp.]
MARAHPLLPYLVAAAGVGLFSLMDATMKRASLEAGVYSALLLRNFIGSGLMLPVWLAGERRLPRGAALKVHVQRSAVVACMAPLFFFAIVRLPLAESIALSFIAPLIALYLAAVLLGETIRPSAIAASLLGIAGVMAIGYARFGQGNYSPDAALGVAAVLVSAVFYAINLVLQRRQALLAKPVEVALFQNLFTGLILLFFAPWLFSWPALSTLGHIAISAALAVGALLLLSWAYARAEAQALVPTEYTGFLWAALFGWLWFGERVTPAIVAGALLIVAGCLIAARQRTEQTSV